MCACEPNEQLPSRATESIYPTHVVDPLAFSILEFHPQLASAPTNPISQLLSEILV